MPKPLKFIYRRFVECQHINERGFIRFAPFKWQIGWIAKDMITQHLDVAPQIKEKDQTTVCKQWSVHSPSNPLQFRLRHCVKWQTILLRFFFLFVSIALGFHEAVTLVTKYTSRQQPSNAPHNIWKLTEFLVKTKNSEKEMAKSFCQLEFNQFCCW